MALNVTWPAPQEIGWIGEPLGIRTRDLLTGDPALTAPHLFFVT